MKISPQTLAKIIAAIVIWFAVGHLIYSSPWPAFMTDKIVDLSSAIGVQGAEDIEDVFLTISFVVAVVAGVAGYALLGKILEHSPRRRAGAAAE